MAPEILRYEKYDARSDLWSVGAVLYEIATGRAPFRAQNHLALLKKIDDSKGIKFPDEDPTSSANKNGGGGSSGLPVPEDIKELIRMLLKRNPIERANYEEFFASRALAKSKFPRPQESIPESSSWNDRPPTPEHHKVIPPEVLDPHAMIPPSKFNFRHPSGNDNSSPVDPDKQHLPNSVHHARRPLSTEGSFIPGETEEDGNLRREYVLVGDGRAVEFNKAVDGKKYCLLLSSVESSVQKSRCNHGDLYKTEKHSLQTMIVVKPLPDHLQLLVVIHQLHSLQYQ